jgi:hypothetical protein
MRGMLVVFESLCPNFDWLAFFAERDPDFAKKVEDQFGKNAKIMVVRTEHVQHSTSSHASSFLDSI